MTKQKQQGKELDQTCSSADLELGENVFLQLVSPERLSFLGATGTVAEAFYSPQRLHTLNSGRGEGVAHSRARVHKVTVICLHRVPERNVSTHASEGRE